MRSLAFPILIAANLLACTPKASLTIEVEVRRSDLNELEVVLQKPDGVEVTRCRIYADANSVGSDSCPFENADVQQRWNGEERIQERLSFLVYGDLDATSIQVTIAGYKNGRQMGVDSGSAEFLSESPQTLSLKLLAITEVAKSCSKSFDSISGAPQGANNFAMSILKTDVGHDLVYARGRTLNRFRYTKTASSSDECIQEAQSIDLGTCSVLPQHMVVGSFFGSSNEQAGLICGPSMGARTMPTRLKIVDFSTQDQTQKVFASGLRPEQLSPLTLATRRSGTNNAEISFEALITAAQTATAGPPSLSILRAMPNENQMASYSNLSQTRPLITCERGIPCDQESLNTCPNGQLLVSESGCVSCRMSNDFTSIPTCSATEIYYKTPGATQELSCIPRTECLYEEYLSGGMMSRVSAPYAPMSYTVKDQNGIVRNGIVLAGYAGAFAYLNSDSEWVEQTKNTNRSSLLQPSCLSTDGKPPVVITDAGSQQQSLAFRAVSLERNPVTSLATISLPENSPPYSSARSYAIGTDTDNATHYTVLGVFSVDRANGDDFVTSLDISKISLSTNENRLNPVTSENMRVTFPLDSLSTGVRGMASIRLADLDGDPRDTELLVYQPEYGAQLHGFKVVSGELVSLRGFPIAMDNREALTEERPLVVILADLDSDGKIEIIAGDTTTLRVYSLGVDSYNSAKLHWPMERLDPQNSGAYYSAGSP